MRVYVVDTETASIEAAPDSVVEVAVVPVEVPDPGQAGEAGLVEDEFWSSLTKPTCRISFGAMGVHGITETMVADAPSLVDALRASPLAGGGSPLVLVAHNAPFDRAFLETALDQMSAESRSSIFWVDTYRVARHVLPGCEGYGNQSLRYELGLTHPALECTQPHRALADCLVTALLLQRILREQSLREISRTQDNPILLTKFPFGKHRGQELTKVPADYLTWMLRSDLDSDCKYSAQFELDRRVATNRTNLPPGRSADFGSQRREPTRTFDSGRASTGVR